MKKTIYASLFALTLILAACGNQGSNGTSTDTTVMNNTDTMTNHLDSNRADTMQHPATPAPIK